MRSEWNHAKQRSNATGVPFPTSNARACSNDGTAAGEPVAHRPLRTLFRRFETIQG